MLLSVELLGQRWNRRPMVAMFSVLFIRCRAQTSGSPRPGWFRVKTLVVLLGSLLAVPSRLEATSVVALIDPLTNRLVIAADCRVNRESGPLSECKIIQEGSCVVAMAGLYGEASSGFKLRQLVQQACQKEGDLRNKAEEFLRISQLPYEQAVRRMRKGRPGNYAQTVAFKPTEVVFAGIQDGHLALIVRGLVANLEGKVSIERFESISPGQSRTGYFLGLNGHIRRYIKSHPDWVNEGMVELAHRFVQMEIEAHPDLAGPPISELEINTQGRVRWSSDGACHVGNREGTGGPIGSDGKMVEGHPE
jgi:hypothetical protein